MLDFRMETFLTVCRCMNFTRASEELHITQPAVSQHIRFLERHYKTKLFCYEGKRLELTPAGQILRNASLVMMHDERSLESRLLKPAGRPLSVRFGVTASAGDTALSDELGEYMREHPDVQIHIETGETDDLLGRLDRGELEAALVEGFFPKNEYDFLHYSAEDYIAISSPEYPFAGRPQRLEDLLGERLLLPESGSGTLKVLENMLRSCGLSLEAFPRRVQISSPGTIKALTKAGCGITFLFEIAVREELQSGQLMPVRLKDIQSRHDFSFIWRKNNMDGEIYRKIFGRFSARSRTKKEEK